MWFSTPLGLSQFVPAADRPQSPPPVLITGVSVGGVAWPVSDLGQSAVAGLRLRAESAARRLCRPRFPPGRDASLPIYVGRRRSRLGAATDQRTVIYARLASGSYRFRVRARDR